MKMKKTLIFFILIVVFISSACTIAKKVETKEVMPNCDDKNNCTDDSWDLTNKKCINQDITYPKNIQFSYNDPRDYLTPFFNALSKNDSRTAKCFFSSKINEEDIWQYLNLDKDFSEYTFYINSYDAFGEEVAVVISDSNFKKHDVKFYSKKMENTWRIIKIDDKDIILK